jgi:hypothetical protein
MGHAQKKQEHDEILTPLPFQNSLINPMDSPLSSLAPGLPNPAEVSPLFSTSGKHPSFHMIHFSFGGLVKF